MPTWRTDHVSLYKPRRCAARSGTSALVLQSSAGSIKTYRVDGVVQRNIIDPDPLNRLKDIPELADAAKGDTAAVVKLAVGDAHVGAVGLERDGIVAVVHRPAVKVDVRGVDCIRAVVID